MSFRAAKLFVIKGDDQTNGCDRGQSLSLEIGCWMRRFLLTFFLI